MSLVVFTAPYNQSAIQAFEGIVTKHEPDADFPYGHSTIAPSDKAYAEGRFPAAGSIVRIDERQYVWVIRWHADKSHEFVLQETAPVNA